MSVWSEIYPWLISGFGGAVGAALLLPTRLGEALVQFRTNRLLEGFKSEQSRELEQFKAEQSRELESVKEQLNHLGDRGRRSNEMEFLAIKTVWENFVKAWLSANTCVSAMIPIPDFDRMPEEEIKKLAVSKGFGDRDQETLLNSDDKQTQYVRLVEWQNVNAARKDIYQARLTLREQRIFMPPELTKQFSDVIERMSSVQIEREVALGHPGAPDMFKNSSAWIADCVPVFDDMAAQANRRLFREERDAARPAMERVMPTRR
jgi:hypothetical protein